ncbi:MAG: hypothetical protein K8F92_03880 [Hyphomicrobium sp.]|uniref:hypothetical protein n=1 Tax=Hyphomicrobium sp. TaxID=82 RepID=UPI001326C22D|nr:hypothetical protein [Hyphomicrobium sp.]KAB2943512.1 MAG: hypothetical protein F9K20_02180 [Hyphomicrobium sp.]MBZ0208779.1 hypothetical protein [Hyphomicrobium sp.]
MANAERREVTVVLTDEHMRLLIEAHLIKPEEAADGKKLAAAVQGLVDRKIGYPQEAWHQWDDWAKGLE